VSSLAPLTSTGTPHRRIDHLGRELVTVSRNLNDIITSLITLPPLGMALASAYEAPVAPRPAAIVVAAE
jgi:hypothetical protein